MLHKYMHYTSMNLASKKELFKNKYNLLIMTKSNLLNSLIMYHYLFNLNFATNISFLIL